jgi:hydroxymethylbilane synthase
MHIRIGTRKSPLAIFQAETIADFIKQKDNSAIVTLVGIDSQGDVDQASSLGQIGGQGVFVNAIRKALINKEIDLAVHSAKDMPPVDLDELVVGAYPTRADVRDVLVGKKLSQLDNTSIVRTGSARRKLQIIKLVKGITFEDLRGNIATRLNKIPENGSVIVAKAALDRLKLTVDSLEILDIDTMLPQIGQGAIAVEVLKNNEELKALLDKIDDKNVRAELTVEREFLKTLGSGCSSPVGGLARFKAGSESGSTSASLTFTGMIGNLEKEELIKQTFETNLSEDLTEFGRNCGTIMLAKASEVGIL